MLSDRPKTPTKEDCCGNSCNPCVFDIHKKLLDQWEKNKNNKKRFHKTNNFLVQTLYKTFEVIAIKKINNDYVTIILCYKNNNSSTDNNNYCVCLNPGQHVYINISEWSRPFTPISWTDNKLKILIRIYPQSNVENKVNNLVVGSEIRVRGPYGEFKYRRNEYKKIVMFCIGSGIAAFYPIIKFIVDDELDETCIQLIAGFKSVNLMPLKKELQELAGYWNVNCIIFITEQDKSADIYNIEVKHHRIDDEACKSILKNELPESTLLLICGREDFNELLEKCVQQLNFLHYFVFR